MSVFCADALKSTMDTHFAVLPLGMSEFFLPSQSSNNQLRASDVIDTVVSQLPDLHRFLRLPHPRTGVSPLVTEITIPNVAFQGLHHSSWLTSPSPTRTRQTENASRRY